MGRIRQRRLFRRSWRALIADARGPGGDGDGADLPYGRHADEPHRLRRPTVYRAAQGDAGRDDGRQSFGAGQQQRNGHDHRRRAQPDSRISKPDPLPLQRQHRRGRRVATAGHRQLQWNRDRNGRGSWANANGTPRPVGQQLSVDTSIASAFSGSSANNNPVCGNIPANSVPSNYLILGEVQYPFQPTGIYFTVASITLSDSIMMIPRAAAEITVQ